MKHLMLVGFGAMAKEVVSRLPNDIKVSWVVAKSHYQEEMEQFFPYPVSRIDDPTQCNGHPDLVLECASQQAIHQYGSIILQQGWKLAIISTGALADRKLENELRLAETTGKGQLIALSGAVAGMDGLSAAREGGLSSVLYQSSKNPMSWRGSSADTLIDLDNISKPTVFFEGTAREAASLFPANANVAATIAIYGLGMDQTKVRLQADPNTKKNTHNIEVKGNFGEFQIELKGNPLSNNPKTSMLAALSAVEICKRLSRSQQLI